MGSPYPLSYNLKWPWLHVRPSTREHVPLVRRPFAHDFIAHDDRAARRIVCFGDLMGLTADRVPAISPQLQALFASADLVIGNCESPVTHDDKNPRAFYLQRFSMASAYLREALDRCAIDPSRTVLSIANNHIGDQGVAGLAATRDRIAKLGASIVGLLDQPLVVRELGVVRIGIAAWTEWMNRPIGGISRTADALACDWQTMRDQAGVHTMIAAPHWEWEFQHFPCAATVDHARRLATAGFAAIAGHHPHVVQPVSWFGDTVCQFSLGNLMARTLTWPHRWIAVLELRVLDDGRIAGYRSHPFVQLDHAIVPLAQAPPRLRGKIERRIELLSG